MQQIGLLDGSDFDFLLNPFRAFPGNAFLLELVGKLKALGIEDEGLRLRLAGIKAVHKGWLAEEKIEVVNLVQSRLQRSICVDREIGRDDGKPRPIRNLRSQEIGNRAARVVVSQS